MQTENKKYMSTSELKLFSSLKNKKNRNELNLFLIEGDKIIDEALKEKWEIKAVVVDETKENLLKSFIDYLISFEIKVIFAKKQDYKKLSELKTPPGILAVVKKKIKKLHFNDSIIALENIQDPGNLGTIIRSCDWFGFRNILASDNCADVFNAKTLRSSMGSLFRVNYQEEKNFYEFLKKLKEQGYMILTTDARGVNINKINLSRAQLKKFILVLCNESFGASPEALSLSDKIISIPGEEGAESLNVSMAGAILLYHFYLLTNF